MILKNTTLQNSLFNNNQEINSSWKKLTIEKNQFNSDETRKEVEKLFLDANIQKNYFAGDYKIAYDKIITIVNPENHHLKMQLEIIHHAKMDFNEYLKIFDKITEDLFPLYFNSIKQWFENNLKSLGKYNRKSIVSFLKILIKSSNQKINSDYIIETRNYNIAKTIKLLYNDSASHKDFIEIYNGNKGKIPGYAVDIIDKALDSSNRRLDQSKYDKFIHEYIYRFEFCQKEFKNTLFEVIREILYEFEMYKKGIKDPKYSILTGLATNIRLSLEILINLRTKTDFINFLNRSEDNKLDAYKKHCPKSCRSFNKNICKILSNINYAERNMHVGEWIFFLKEYQSFKAGINCKRFDLFNKFLNDKKWEGLTHYYKLGQSMHELYFTNKLSDKIHNVVSGIENYNSLEKMFFKDLLGIDYETLQNTTSIKKEINNKSIYKILLEPRSLNAN